MRLQQYGLQRTGTNALKALVEHNLAGVQVDPAGKHDMPAAGADGYLVSVKDPASWVWSNYRYRKLKYSYQRPPVEVVFDAGFVKDCLAYWEAHTLACLELASAHPGRAVVVQHEHLLRDPGGVLERVRATLGLDYSGRPRNLFEQGYARRGDGTLSGAALIDPARRFHRAYHLRARWMHDVPPVLLAHCLSATRELFDAHPVLGEHIELGYLPGLDRPVRLSAVIMAHPARRQNAERLRRRLGGRARIVYDRVPEPSSDPRQRWEVGRRCWMAHDPRADWHLVIQDDALPCGDMLAGLARALDQVGREGLVSAYTGTGRPDQVNVRRALSVARHRGYSWMSTKSLNWGVAIAAPVHAIPAMVEWCSAEERSHLKYDYRIGVYARDVLGWRTWYTVPSLVDHDESIPSLVGHGKGRVAHAVCEGSALDIDWSRTPPGGLAADWERPA